MLNIVLIVLGILILALLFYLSYKIRRVHLMQYAIDSNALRARQEAESLYRQIESLLGLEKLLKFDSPLPPLRGWAASPDFLLTLAQHTLEKKPKLILECSSGSSTLVLARCLQIIGDGKVISLEHDPVYASKTREQLTKHRLTEWAQVVDAPLIPSSVSGGIPWYSLATLICDVKSIDMLVVDGPPGTEMNMARSPALPSLIHMLKPTCAVFVDDADRDDEKKMVASWLHQFPDFSSTNVPCEKGCVMLSRIANRAE
jgi:hypothetical protein